MVLCANLSGTMYLAVVGLLYALWRIGNWPRSLDEPTRGGCWALCARTREHRRFRLLEVAWYFLVAQRARGLFSSSFPLAPVFKPEAQEQACSEASGWELGAGQRLDPSPRTFEEEKGSCFTIKRPDATDVNAVLHTVDPPTGWENGTGTINLYVHVPEGEQLRTGTYRVVHPRLPPFTARIEHVQAGGREPDEAGYRAVVETARRT